MSLVAVVGDGCTTTALGLAAAWPVGEPCMLAEFDPAGGCLAAWLDVPRSPGLADVVASASPGSWATVRIDVAALAVRRRRAGCADEVGRGVGRGAGGDHGRAAGALRARSAGRDRRRRSVAGADAGRWFSRPASSSSPTDSTEAPPQRPPWAWSVSPRSPRNWRLARSRRSSPSLATVPYGADEVARFVRADDVVAVADDPWAAAVLAGRAGSATRLRRSPLIRSIVELAGVVSHRLPRVSPADVWAQPFDDRPIGERS